MAAFPGEIYRAPRSWAERAYRSRIYFDELNTGQVFALLEQLELRGSEARAARGFRR